MALRRWLLRLVVGVVAVVAAEQCDEPAKVDEGALHSVCPPAKGGGCQSVVLRNVCLVQETFVVYAPEDADEHPDGLGTKAAGEFDVTDVPAWFRHASPQRMEDLTHASHHPHAHGDAVLGHQVQHTPVQVRFAAAHEADAAPSFQSCVTPVVTWSTWIFNLAETFLRLPTNVRRLHKAQAFSAPVYVPVTPLKLPLEAFHEWMLAPWSKNTSRTVSLFEFSAVRHAHQGAASDDGAEQEACYATVVLLKVTGGGYPDLPPTADDIKAHLAPAVPTQSPWKSVADNSSTVTRIVFETRPNAAMRQFRNLTAALEACEKDARFECKTRAFGSTPAGVLTDIALMQDAHVLVAYHGAGEMNSLWMRHGRAILEIRGAGFGSTHGWWPAFWWPMIGMQTGHVRHWWALNVEDLSHNENSELETQGLETNPGFNARDRFVILNWELMLLPMLDKILPFVMEPSPELATQQFAALYGEHGTGVVWAFNNSSQPLELQPPVFCDGNCKSVSTVCKPC